MKPIELTKQDREKLVEMCKELFPEYDRIYISDANDHHVVNVPCNYEINFMKSTNPSDFSNTFNWFEFCYKHLAKKIFKNNYYKLTAFTNLTIIGNVHPIDYLHQHYKSQQ